MELEIQDINQKIRRFDDTMHSQQKHEREYKDLLARLEELEHKIHDSRHHDSNVATFIEEEAVCETRYFYSLF